MTEKSIPTIKEIANPGTAMEMKLAVLRRATALGRTEEDVWEELDEYRKRTGIIVDGRVEHVKDILVRVFKKLKNKLERGST